MTQRAFWRNTLVLALLIQTTNLYADCISLVKGPIAFDVKSCGQLNPEQSFDMGNSKYKFIRDLPPADRQKFYNSYRGLLVRGKVARSMAVRSGLSPEKGALNGEDIAVFVRPGDGQCSEMDGQRVKAVLDEACCEGGGDAPCLLQTTYVLKEIKTLGKATLESGNKERKVATTSPNYAKAEALFRKKDYRNAAKHYEMVREEGKLDVTGYYNLGLAYRLLDKCEAAVPVLEHVFKKAGKQEFWADEEPMIRKSNLLLARCYSKINKADFAMVILQSYLLDPVKFRNELRQALNHKDFGWIRTTKEYQYFQKEAEAALMKSGK